MAADSSTSAQKRRVTKPLIEKRRRARINSSLAQLKDMVAKPNTNTQENRSNRLEKADILEMTVEYVKRIHSVKNATENSPFDSATHLEFNHSFEEGYRLCMSEVRNFFYKNYRKQASKEFLNRSLQNYLQEKFQRTATAENHSIDTTGIAAFDRSFSPKRLSPEMCNCKCERTSTHGKSVRKNIEESYDFHSESSNFGSNYSSPSTDDEMTENLSVSVTKGKSRLREELLNASISQRHASQHSSNKNVSSNDRMWRPW